jgi:hypothetical protein
LKNIITIRQSIFIEKQKEVVWDFTQDYSNRKNWDSAVIEATVLQTSPNRIVKLQFRDNSTATFVYKQDERPNKTSLSAKEVQSTLLLSGGGSWSYDTKDGGTIWTQNNTLILKNHFWIRVLIPFYKLLFSFQVKKAMKKAKELIEQ